MGFRKYTGVVGSDGLLQVAVGQAPGTKVEIYMQGEGEEEVSGYVGDLLRWQVSGFFKSVLEHPDEDVWDVL
jgi:hypothetical protein